MEIELNLLNIYFFTFYFRHPKLKILNTVVAIYICLKAQIRDLIKERIDCRDAASDTGERGRIKMNDSLP